MKKGWIKQYRRDIDDLRDLTEPEYRYYTLSCLFAVWDTRNKLFGTFDARTKTIKAELLPSWSTGKINTTKNLLIKRGFYKKVPDNRLHITNARIVFGKSRDVENLVQNYEGNIRVDEKEIQQAENRLSSIVDMKRNLANRKRVS